MPGTQAMLSGNCEIMATCHWVIQPTVFPTAEARKLLEEQWTLVPLVSTSQQGGPDLPGSTASLAAGGVCLAQGTASQGVRQVIDTPGLPLENLTNQPGWMGNLGTKVTSKQKGSETTPCSCSSHGVT